jgi:hypothetical protein
MKLWMAVCGLVSLQKCKLSPVSADILPTLGASEECDEAAAAVEEAEGELENVLEEYKTLLK